MNKLQVIMGAFPGRNKEGPIPVSEESQSFNEDLQQSCPSLSRTQRLVGFGTCFVSGYLVSFLATFALIGGSKTATTFGILYSFGNVLALMGTGFLVGPTAQVKAMFHPTRRVATAIYLLLIVLVLIVAIAVPNSGPLVLLLVVIQCIAAAWYSASYIPFARKFIVEGCKNICGTV